MGLRKIRIQRSILIMFFCGVSHISQADTDIHFSGTLVAEPCQLATDSEEQTVDFGVIVAKQFINNSLTKPERFNIRLINCDVSVSQDVIFTFNGDEDTAQPGHFSVIGEAKGIAIMLTSDGGDKIKPGEKLTARTLIDADNIFTFQAAVSAPDFNVVTAGEFTATLLFSLEYN